MGFRKMGGLFVPESFAEAEEGAPVLDELATTRNGRDVTRGFVDNLAVLTPQDTVLQLRCQGNYQLYEEILRDDQVAATFMQRRMAVIARELEVVAGGPGAADQRAADHLREVIDHIKWDAVTAKMLFGVFYGFAVGECLWARDGATITLDKVKVRKQRRFRWSPDGALKLLTATNVAGERMPERKFWTFSTGADNDDEPYGLGLAHWLYWPTLFKRNGIKFWMLFLEKFSGPTAVGHYPRNATEEDKRRLLGALRAIQLDSGVALPEGMAVSLIEAARSGTADYTALVARMDAAIAKVVLGQTMTTDQGSSRSQAEVHLDVRDGIVKSDADLICESFNAGPVRWLTEWNYPGARPPQVWRSMANEPDLTSQSKREKTIFDMGFKPTLRHVQETYGGEWEERPANWASPSGMPAFAEPVAAGQSAPTTVPEHISARLSEAAAPAIERMLDRVRHIIDEARSLEEVRDRLIEVYAEHDPAELAGPLEQALLAAELAGRAEVQDGR